MSFIWRRLAAASLTSTVMVVALGAAVSPSMGAGKANTTLAFVNGVNGVCQSFQPSVKATQAKEQSADRKNTLSEFAGVLDTAASVLQQIETRLATISPPPAAKVRYERALNDLRHLATAARTVAQKLRRAGQTQAAILRAFKKFQSTTKTTRTFQRTFRRLGLTACTFTSG